MYEFSLAELQQLDFGRWFVESDPFGQISEGNVAASDVEAFRGTKIPTLENALEFTRSNHWWVNIEIKDASGTPSDAVIVSEVVRLVEKMGMEDQVLISSFNWDYLSQVKALNPDLATGVLANSIVVDPVSLMKKLNAQAFHPGIKVTLAAQVQQLRENNYGVNVWTVNDVSDMERLIEMGVTGIITDFPNVYTDSQSLRRSSHCRTGLLPTFYPDLLLKPFRVVWFPYRSLEFLFFAQAILTRHSQQKQRPGKSLQSPGSCRSGCR